MRLEGCFFLAGSHFFTFDGLLVGEGALSLLAAGAFRIFCEAHSFSAGVLAASDTVSDDSEPLGSETSNTVALALLLLPKREPLLLFLPNRKLLLLLLSKEGSPSWVQTTLDGNCSFSPLHS